MRRGVTRSCPMYNAISRKLAVALFAGAMALTLSAPRAEAYWRGGGGGWHGGGWHGGGWHGGGGWGWGAGAAGFALGAVTGALLTSPGYGYGYGYGYPA